MRRTNDTVTQTETELGEVGQSVAFRDLLLWGGIFVLGAGAFLLGAFGTEMMTNATARPAVAATVAAPETEPSTPPEATKLTEQEAPPGASAEAAPETWGAENANVGVDSEPEAVEEQIGTIGSRRPPKPSAPPSDLDVQSSEGFDPGEDPWATLDAADPADALSAEQNGESN